MKTFTSEELQERAKHLISSEFSSGPRAQPLFNKQGIFLALCGEKPVSESVSNHMVDIPGREGYQEGRPDDPIKVGAFLHELGLAFSLKTDEHALMAVVGRGQSEVDAYRKAEAAFDSMTPEEIYRTAGRLFGYPESAVEAFATDDSMSAEEQVRIQTEAGLPTEMFFCFSKDHWKAELETMRKWYELLEHYGLG